MVSGSSDLCFLEIWKVAYSLDLVDLGSCGFMLTEPFRCPIPGPLSADLAWLMVPSSLGHFPHPGLLSPEPPVKGNTAHRAPDQNLGVGVQVTEEGAEVTGKSRDCVSL